MFDPGQATNLLLGKKEEVDEDELEVKDPDDYTEEEAEEVESVTVER